MCIEIRGGVTSLSVITRNVINTHTDPKKNIYILFTNQSFFFFSLVYLAIIRKTWPGNVKVWQWEIVILIAKSRDTTFHLRRPAGQAETVQRTRYVMWCFTRTKLINIFTQGSNTIYYK